MAISEFKWAMIVEINLVLANNSYVSSHNRFYSVMQLES